MLGFKKALQQALQERNLIDPQVLAVSEFQIEQLGVFFLLLEKWNQKTNLTAHRTLEECLEKNFLDSLKLAEVIQCHTGWTSTASEIHLLDIGSGAGFPALVLKVMFPEVSMTLVESNLKKSAFLATVIRTLGLKNIRVVSKTLTLETVTPLGFLEAFDGIVSRATIPIPHLLPLAERCLKPNGLFWGMDSQSESPVSDLGALSLQKTENYLLPASKSPRSILCFFKT